MEIRQLRHFIALAEEGSFTQAARRERIVQSGLSSSVQALERDVKAELYVRGSRPVRLTAAGTALLDSARRTVAEAELGQRRVRDVLGLVEGPFRVGLVELGSVSSSCPFVGWLSGFAAAHPGLEISASQPVTSRALRMVADGELDCALVATNQEAPPGLTLMPLASEPLVLICPAGHPLASGGPVPLAQLETQPFVDAAPGLESRDIVDAAFAERGLFRRVACEVSDLATIVELVRARLGVAIVPRSAGLSPHLAAVPLADAGLSYALKMAFPSGAAISPAAEAFARHVSAAVHLPGLP